VAREGKGGCLALWRAIGSKMEKDWSYYCKFTNGRAGHKVNPTKGRPCVTDRARSITEWRRDLTRFSATWRQVAGQSAPQATVEAEVKVFNQMVVALQARFGEGLAGRNICQIQLEVRLLAEGVRSGCRFPDPGRARWQPDQSVTGYCPGDRIALNEEVFTRLSDAFLAHLSRLAVA
jgi:hypothetical protein